MHERIQPRSGEAAGTMKHAGAELAAAAGVGCVWVRCCGALGGLRLGANNAREGTENCGSCGSCGHGGDMNGGAERSAKVADRARGRSSYGARGRRKGSSQQTRRRRR